ncbi:DNA-binding protein [Vibrio breoganii]
MSKTNQELVYEACDKLDAEGKNPSVQSVLDLISSIKSKSTVHPHFRNWQEDKRRRIKAKQESVELSENVLSVLADEVLRHVKIANEGWHQSVSEAKAHRDKPLKTSKKLKKSTNFQNRFVKSRKPV